jgi:hypothetical protein
MIVEVTRLMDRWLKSEKGVQKWLPSISRFTPEGTEDPMPEIPAIYNDIEDECVAAELDPVKVPALVIFCDSAPETKAQNERRLVARNVLVTVAYITRDTPALKASRDGGYVLRAIRRSLVEFNSLQESREFRDLNGIKILAIDTIEQQRVAANLGRSELWGFVMAGLTVIDS